LNSSRIYTTSDADFWVDLNKALLTIVGTEGGRQVILNPMSGVIVVKAFPGELRAVENFLRATQVMVERQVMLEAKIVSVELKDGYQSGVNWSLFGRGRDTNWNTGTLGPGTSLQPGSGIPITPGAISAGTGDASLSALPGSSVLGGTALTAGLFGLAFQTRNFAALLSFLETQGSVQVLSSPRIATLNNQKAVLKVGSDDFFVTNISTSTTTGTTGTTSSPTITVQPFFSGIALDVTPQIDDDNNVILHIHPSVSQVSEKTKVIDMGTLGTFKLPLASSSVNETDSIVRVQDSNIVAIGGLMKQQQSNDHAGLPGTSNVSIIRSIFGNDSRSTLKSELVILLKPTIIQGDRGWQKDLQEMQGRFPQYDPRQAQ
jgi:MSHA biogenesis protein MshL